MCHKERSLSQLGSMQCLYLVFSEGIERYQEQLP